jgi:hypothetical protein
MKRPLVLLPIALAALASGCEGNSVTSFPPGLDAAGPDPAPAPAEDGGDYPQTLDLQQGQDDTSFYVFATGFVDAPIESVWAAFKIPNVVVDRHGISSYTVDQNVESGYDVSFRTDYTIHQAIVTVQFDLTWREGVVAGTEAAPTQVSVVYDKTWGSDYVSLMEGSIELIAVTPNVTELQFVQRMDAQSTDSSNIASWTNELFSSVVAYVNGQPLP